MAADEAQASSGSLVGASGYKFKKADKKPIKLKLKRVPSARDKKENGTNGAKDAAASLSPVLPQFDEETMANFPEGKQEALETLVCKHCKKMVLKRTAKEHIALCIKSKQEKARKKKEAREAAQRAKERAERGGDDDDDDDDDVRDGKGARKNGVDGDGDDATKKGKKRKAEAEAEGDSKKKKTKKEEQKKAAKPKGPVDVEKQCGVTLPNGAQCARSLTCKSHSMGAKRAVPGRSLPYDMLLAAYQKKNQARQQKAAIDANAPALLDEDLDPALAGPVDSDEERDSIMTAISRSLSRPQPLMTRTLVPTKRKYQLVRMKEMLSNALSGNRSGGLFSVPAESVRSTAGGAGSAPNDTAFPQSVSASPAPTAQPGLKAPMRKASIDVS
ncbi:SAGA complex subunit Sgf73 [Exophiala dermatitidis]|uniref:SAGA-associated factor 73 n=2 Tax=Exophiala dermatitidis TaxID=5970 RepID=H6CAF6_EXODN|nr:SAGA-associated factor 73 [Exophiala dermatitidis NIH/UT8656]KAJ4503602.1 SAGA complex subunit Sgf73 [Exophiala dermatitidis]EHY60120.1 SAGA-associated factor 73 [Exophiala dermatitidis NIH/UT8656]KAJ4504581.1 SAGA complex subunit Sgf73 [Exophiala dermatitidis]KAJ4505334.1 SAGA complex subunit Sgf73 [Exophiala dermatitidis]KAJ4530681.1 SAGA complex subunit Sgf73 [Exophiala dermatitidis]